MWELEKEKREHADVRPLYLPFPPPLLASISFSLQNVYTARLLPSVELKRRKAIQVFSPPTIVALCLPRHGDMWLDADNDPATLNVGSSSKPLPPLNAELIHLRNQHAHFFSPLFIFIAERYFQFSVISRGWRGSRQLCGNLWGAEKVRVAVKYHICGGGWLLTGVL